MAGTMENKSEIEAMEEFAKQMWERYFKPKASEELLGHSLDGYKATVKTNNGDGTLTVTRPFDCCEQTLRCPPGLSETAQPGDQVLAVNLGDASNSFVLCKTDLSGLGGGGGGDAGRYRPLSFDFSTLINDYFTEVVQGPQSSQVETEYEVTRDASGRIDSVINQTDGFTTTVDWGDYDPSSDAARLGDVTQLTVDRLNTTQRIRNYFLQSTADDNYLRIQDGYIQFITGTYSSSTPVQVTDRYGNNLYWNANPTNHTQDGEPTDANGNRIYSTTRVTNWPVYTYTYDDSVLASIAFRVPSGQTAPSGLDFIFTDSNNNESGISMNSAGYMDLYGLRKPTALDFSGWNSGYFSETLDGNVIENWLVQFDSQGRPVKFTDGDGHETVVSW